MTGQMTLQQQLESGLSHHHAGRLAKAEKIYRQILARQSDHIGVINLLGVLNAQMGQIETAADLFRRAIRLKPDYALAHSNLGKALTSMGQLDEAIASCRQAIRLNPEFAEAHNNLGNAFRANGQPTEAIATFRQAVSLKPDHAEAYCNLGDALRTQGRHNEAVAAYRQAVSLKPDYADAQNNLGIALRDIGKLDEAIASFQQAVRLKPDLAETHNNLGTALRDLRRLDEAISSLRQAIRLKPDYAEAHSNLGIVLMDMGRLDEAIASYGNAIRLKPDYAEAYNNAGNALKDNGQLDEAISSFRQAIRLKPDFAEAHSNLVYALQFHSGYDPGTIHDEHIRWNQRHAEPLGKIIQPLINNPDPERRLRIGYVSADFWNHSVSRFLLPLFRRHDRGAFEIICYSDVLNPDGMTESLRACADGWENIVGLSDEQVADKVREDKIDILIDLAGHTANNRLRVFARKPAPVQITYLGYPASTGLSVMDYRLSDRLADPPGETESLHTEKLWRLPVCNWCFAEPNVAPAVEPLPAGGPIRFGSFNNFAKASAAIMDLWAAIMIAIPSSRLIIKSRGLGEENARLRINRRFESHGIPANRLEIRGHQPDFKLHLDTYNQMDIALDTFPYHGTTTTCEALWMGVPVVTLAGSAHVSRVGVSLLSSVGLPELIARTAEEYVSIVVGLAKDLPRLAELRRTFRPRMRASPLMDAGRFARDIESAYRQMWRNWCAAAETQISGEEV